MTHLESSRRSETTLWQRYSLSCPFGFGCSTLLFYRFKNQISEDQGELSVNETWQRLTRERKVLKLSVAIVLGLAVCWLPLSVAWFMLFNSDRTIASSCGFFYF